MRESLRREVVRALESAIAEGRTPGAVALIGRGDEVLCHEARGRRMVVPERRPMEPNTVFDLASLTKPVATAPAIMQLVEREAIGLDDPVRAFIPPFTGDGRERATIRHLLTHSSGLPAYRHYDRQLGADLPPEERRARVVEEISRLPLQHPPGEGFVYSCLGFIVLASIVGTVAGESPDVFVHRSIFEPLGMTDTGFNPPAELRGRCAATEQLPEGTLCGVVHDENARYLGGVGGNAGLFGTAADLSRFVRAMLAGGGLGGRRILRPETVAAMLSAQLELPGARRGLGWDIDSTCTPNIRGEFPDGVGHSGFTGTSIWAHPPSGAYVILLTNRVHLGRDREIAPLRREVATIAARHLLPPKAEGASP